MVRFMGKMPSNEVKITKRIKCRNGGMAILEAGPNGWTVIWPDHSTNYNDEIDTPKNNMAKAFKSFMDVEDTWKMNDRCKFMFDDGPDMAEIREEYDKEFVDSSNEDEAKLSEEDCGEEFKKPSIEDETKLSDDSFRPHDRIRNKKEERRDMVDYTDEEYAENFHECKREHFKLDFPYGTIHRIEKADFAFGAIINYKDILDLKDHGRDYTREALKPVIEKFKHDVKNGIIFGETFIDGTHEQIREANDRSCTIQTLTHKVIGVEELGDDVIVNIQLIETSDNAEKIAKIREYLVNPRESRNPLHLSMRLHILSQFNRPTKLLDISNVDIVLTSTMSDTELLPGILEVLTEN